MEDIVKRYFELKKGGDFYRWELVPFCPKCGRDNPPTTTLGRDKSEKDSWFGASRYEFDICDICGTKIIQKSIKVWLRPKEYAELQELKKKLPEYREEDGKFVFNDGAVVEKVDFNEYFYDLHCTKCDKFWSKKPDICVHLLSWYERRKQKIEERIDTIK
jgi:hypothetical protein